MEPALRTCDAETVEVLNKLCLDMPVTQEDALALGVAVLVELQKRKPLRRLGRYGDPHSGLAAVLAALIED